jgi:hypothetical protein
VLVSLNTDEELKHFVADEVELFVIEIAFIGVAHKGLPHCGHIVLIIAALRVERLLKIGPSIEFCMRYGVALLAKRDSVSGLKPSFWVGGLTPDVMGVKLSGRSAHNAAMIISQPYEVTPK